jgi:cyclopropane fatty-acyl-phospholipid synthase-like methyltransferase
MKNIYSTVDGIVRKYWLGYPAYIIDAYIDRHVFEIGVLQRALGKIEGKSVIDVGGGWGAFAASCAKLGMNAILLEDFGDPGKSNISDPRQSLPSDYGVSVMQRDVIKEGLGKSSASVDAITSFDMIEHLHSSPKDFLHDAMMALRPHGVLLLGVPNCVNLRKRLTVPFGRGQWSDFSTWYDEKLFRGHVREPDIQDLRKIAQDISLSDYQIMGCNWAGFGNSSKIIRAGTRITDKMLRYFPSLCSDIYLMGFKQ